MSIKITIEIPKVKKPVSVYLAGSIEYVNNDYATSWRKIATKKLQKAYKYCKIYDPTKNLVEKRKVSSTKSQSIVEQDFADISESDILLVEMNRNDVPYIGTSMEIRYAFDHHKQIIVWSEHNANSFFLKYHANIIVPTLDQAINQTIIAMKRCIAVPTMQEKLCSQCVKNLGNRCIAFSEYPVAPDQPCYGYTDDVDDLEQLLEEIIAYDHNVPTPATLRDIKQCLDRHKPYISGKYSTEGVKFWLQSSENLIPNEDW